MEPQGQREAVHLLLLLLFLLLHLPGVLCHHPVQGAEYLQTLHLAEGLFAGQLESTVERKKKKTCFISD